MFESLIGGVIGAIGGFISRRRLYSNEQMEVLREIERIGRLEDEDTLLYPSSSMSETSHSVSSTTQDKPVGIGVGTSYFDDLEERLKPEDFFKKEEFDID